MLVSEEDQALVCFCFFLIFIRLNHLNPPVNGQAVIFLTGLLEVFIIYSTYLISCKSCKSAQLDRALPQPPLLQQELTFYPSGQIEQSSRLFIQRSILGRVKKGRDVDCGSSLVWADLELSTSGCDAAASKASFGTSHVCEKLNPLDPFNAQHHWYGCGGGGPIWSNFIITAKYLMTKNLERRLWLALVLKKQEFVFLMKGETIFKLKFLFDSVCILFSKRDNSSSIPESIPSGNILIYSTKNAKQSSETWLFLAFCWLPLISTVVPSLTTW